jgi:hypothetical protein
MNLFSILVAVVLKLETLWVLNLYANQKTIKVQEYTEAFYISLQKRQYKFYRDCRILHTKSNIYVMCENILLMQMHKNTISCQMYISVRNVQQNPGILSFVVSH